MSFCESVGKPGAQVVLAVVEQESPPIEIMRLRVRHAGERVALWRRVRRSHVCEADRTMWKVEAGDEEGAEAERKGESCKGSL